MNQNPIMVVENLSHTYANGTPGLSNISFSVNKGDFILVAGRNGSGKSTLFRHLNGLQSPTTGSISLHGSPLKEQKQTALTKVGLIFQDADTQIVGETVWEDVIFGPCNLKLSPDEIHDRGLRALTAMNLLHLKERDPSTLSGGEKRKLAIAGVLAMEPEILVFDEPFSNLDYPGTRDLIASVVSLHRAGHTIILSTHDLEKIIFYATRMLLLSRGTLVHDDMPQVLLNHLEPLGIRQPCAQRLGMPIAPWDRDAPPVAPLSGKTDPTPMKNTFREQKTQSKKKGSPWCNAPEKIKIPEVIHG
ncbi:biotin transport system ATP-binding protein [Desulfocicer vacuolatum DSM 3385]|uniref:Biotin transport system ATP-binding protein n=1 Tax=Desulfocicer vacuolatum DSM 3385 TaxID=1121400 RepID=A0A1W2BS65_9BACT|nr:ABC transporter ATP-binding protein [Desulfocicer vacuolatum]SMC75721.1 biotin transport system ATP-binding protein [Desulfocicer vacuolatum DSM 3385]